MRRDRFVPGRLGDWVVFCDICGQKCFAHEASKLASETGRGGLIVCPKDADKIDYGLIPYIPRVEKIIPWTHVNHLNTTNGADTIDYDTQDVETVGVLVLIGVSQNDTILSTSQGDSQLAYNR